MTRAAAEVRGLWSYSERKVVRSILGDHTLGTIHHDGEAFGEFQYPYYVEFVEALNRGDVQRVLPLEICDCGRYGRIYLFLKAELHGGRTIALMGTGHDSEIRKIHQYLSALLA